MSSEALAPEPPARLHAGAVWTRGDVGELVEWVASGLVDASVLELAGGWQAVVPEAVVDLPAPYDDPFAITASRELPVKLRPALGLFVRPGRGVLTVHRRRTPLAWGVWTPSVGLAATVGLPVAGAAEVCAAWGITGERRDRVRRLLHRPGTDPWLTWAGLLEVLEIPGAWLLENIDLGGELPDGSRRRFVPGSREQASRFNAAIADHVDLIHELEES